MLPTTDRRLFRFVFDGLLAASLFALGSVVAARAALQGDANCDGFVNTADLPAVVDGIFGNGSCAGVDVNGDGRATAADLSTEIPLLVPAISPTPTDTPLPPVSPTRTPTWTIPPTATRSLTPTPTRSRTATPTATPTPTRGGPLVSYFGVLVHADGCVCCTDPCYPEPTPFIENGRPVFEVPGGQLLLIVEGRTVDGLPPAVGSYTGPNPTFGDGRPDIQIQTTQALGQGSAAVCDDGYHSAVTNGGGVYPIPTPDFTLDTTQPVPGTITGALYDFGCRFAYHPKSEPCTTCYDHASPCLLTDLPENNKIGASQAQFCNHMDALATFNPGDSLVTVRLRDQAGNFGPTAQIVIRVNTPTPTPGP